MRDTVGLPTYVSCQRPRVVVHVAETPELLAMCDRVAGAFAYPTQDASVSEVCESCFGPEMRIWSMSYETMCLPSHAALRGQTVLCAREQTSERVLGYLYMGVSWNYNEVRPHAFLSSLCVAPDQRRSGIGSRLVDAAKQHAIGQRCGTLRLTIRPRVDRPPGHVPAEIVAQNNDRHALLCAFYTRHGFVRTASPVDVSYDHFRCDLTRCSRP
jgi:ribosomal protein S18 acetylase RimI-like enzyme